MSSKEPSFVSNHCTQNIEYEPGESVHSAALVTEESDANDSRRAVTGKRIEHLVEDKGD
ncbi:hypothetical protein L915_20465, partial [Phytophthora nicotianae]